MQRQIQRQRQLSVSGWKAPENKPYSPLGEFANVLTAVHGIKANLPNTVPSLKGETKRNIRGMKRNRDPSFQGGEPGRIFSILNGQQDEIKKLRAYAGKGDRTQT